MLLKSRPIGRENFHWMSAHARMLTGFVIGPILLAVIIGAVLVGSFALTQTSTPTTSLNETNRLVASTVIQQGATLRTAVERMLANGAASAEITFEVSGVIPATSLFNSGATGGGVANPTAPPNSFSLSSTQNAQKWHFSRNVIIPGVGTATAELVALLPDLKLGVCRYINNILYNAAVDNPAVNPYATTGTAVGSFQDTTAVTANTVATAVDLSAVSVLSTRQQGCIATADNPSRYVFYRVLAESGS